MSNVTVTSAYHLYEVAGENQSYQEIVGVCTALFTDQLFAVKEQDYNKVRQAIKELRPVDNQIS